MGRTPRSGAPRGARRPWDACPARGLLHRPDRDAPSSIPSAARRRAGPGRTDHAPGLRALPARPEGDARARRGWRTARRRDRRAAVDRAHRGGGAGTRGRSRPRLRRVDRRTSRMAVRRGGGPPRGARTLRARRRRRRPACRLAVVEARRLHAAVAGDRRRRARARGAARRERDDRRPRTADRTGEGPVKRRDEFDLPPELEADMARARRLEQVTLGVMVTAIAAVGLAMGSSQAMKAAWVEDLLSLVPPIAFLVAGHYRHRPSTDVFPYGFHRSVSIAFLAASVALTIFGGYLL